MISSKKLTLYLFGGIAAFTGLAIVFRDDDLLADGARHTGGAAGNDLLDRLLACGPERALASAVLDPAVRRLLEQRDPDLRQTALVYLEAGGNVQETAAALNVHRQTVYYRLQKVEQVTGLTLARGDHRLVLHLGLTMSPFVTDVSET